MVPTITWGDSIETHWLSVLQDGNYRRVVQREFQHNWRFDCGSYPKEWLSFHTQPKSIGAQCSVLLCSKWRTSLQISSSLYKYYKLFMSSNKHLLRLLHLRPQFGLMLLLYTVSSCLCLFPHRKCFLKDNAESSRITLLHQHTLTTVTSLSHLIWEYSIM